MAATSTIIAVGAALAGGALASKMLSPDIPAATAPDMPKADDAGKKKAADAAGNQARMRAQAAGGRSDTILTGSQGLGEIGSQNLQKTTLLGY